MEIGIHPRDFWKMTLREFFYYVDAYNKRQEREFKLQKALVWTGEALRRTKKLKSLKSFLFEGRTRIPNEEELKVLRQDHNDMIAAYMAQKQAT